METREVRFLKNVANRREVRPGIFDVFGYDVDDVAPIPVELAAKWIGSGLCEPVIPSRSAEVETATREPRSERAVAFKRRGRR